MREYDRADSEHAYRPLRRSDVNTGTLLLVLFVLATVPALTMASAPCTLEVIEQSQREPLRRDGARPPRPSNHPEAGRIESDAGLDTAPVLVESLIPPAQAALPARMPMNRTDEPCPPPIAGGIRDERLALPPPTVG